MNNKLTGSLAFLIAFAMFGYMSFSIRTANAQAAKTSTPVKSEPVKSAGAQAASGAEASLAPTGAKQTTLGTEPAPEPVEQPAKAEGGCCGWSGK